MQTLLPIAGLLVNIPGFEPFLKLFKPLEVGLRADQVLLEILRLPVELPQLLGFHDFLMGLWVNTDGL
jgi:ABC-type transport system involved in cytochrome c biogenesis permease component